MTQDVEQFTIRRLRENDTDRLYDFFTRLSDRTKYFFAAHPFDRETAQQYTSLQEIARKDFIRYVASAVRDGYEVFAGYVFFWKFDTPEPWVGVCVSDDFHRKGLGSLLMRHLEETARAHQKTCIWLTTALDNYPAQSLYVKAGYIFVGKTQSEGDSGLRVEHLMRLPL